MTDAELWKSEATEHRGQEILELAKVLGRIGIWMLGCVLARMVLGCVLARMRSVRMSARGQTDGQGEILA